LRCTIGKIIYIELLSGRARGLYSSLYPYNHMDKQLLLLVDL